MSRTVSKDRPLTSPQRCSAPDKGSEQLELQVTVEPTVIDGIRGVYRALQSAVAKFGGVTEMACAVGKSKGDVSLRVRREQDTKGDVQRAPLDYLAYFNWEAREEFLGELCREWGFKKPEPLAAPTVAEKLRALEAELNASGDMGDQVLRLAAKRAGFDVGAFRR